MTSNPSNAHDSSQPPLPANAPESSDSARPSGQDRPSQPLCDTVPGALRDRFELLSAYLDGEVTASERRQVEAWLKSDPQVQCLYTRLLKLRRGVQSLPIPADRPIEQTVDRVLAQLERRPRQLLVWGGMAIAGMFFGALSMRLPSVEHATSQIADSPTPIAQVNPDALMIALDRPVIEIPKAPVSSLQPANQTASAEQFPQNIH